MNLVNAKAVGDEPTAFLTSRLGGVLAMTVMFLI